MIYIEYILGVLGDGENMDLRRRSSDSKQGMDDLTLINRKAITIGIWIMAILMLFVIRKFLEPIVIAAALASLVYPISEFLRNKVTHGHRGVAAFFTTALFLLAFLIPASLLSTVAVEQASSLLLSGAMDVSSAATKISIGLEEMFKGYPQFHSLIIQTANLDAMITEAIMKVVGFVRNAIQSASANVLWLIVQALITLFTLFYFLKDGESITAKLREISPFRRSYDEMVITRFLLVSRAVVRGTIIIALVQSSIATATFFFCGIPGWMLWGVVMFFLAMIPMLGCWVIMLPAGVAMLASGNIGEGVAILLMSLIVVSNIDNVIRPRLVGSHAKLHDLVVFFAVIGGLTTFGVLGVIVGPVLAALFVVLLEMYGIEFSKQLTNKQDTTKIPAVAPETGDEDLSDD